MRRTLALLAIAGAAFTLAACGHNTEQRAATGAVAGAVVGGPVGAAAGFDRVPTIKVCAKSRKNAATAAGQGESRP